MFNRFSSMYQHTIELASNAGYTASHATYFGLYSIKSAGYVAVAAAYSINALGTTAYHVATHVPAISNSLFNEVSDLTAYAFDSTDKRAPSYAPPKQAINHAIMDFEQIASTYVKQITPIGSALGNNLSNSFGYAKQTLRFGISTLSSGIELGYDGFKIAGAAISTIDRAIFGELKPSLANNRMRMFATTTSTSQPINDTALVDSCPARPNSKQSA